MIEVEKKVFLEKKQLDYIENNATFINKKVFRDTYYDDEKYSLTLQNYWLRKRENRFELKRGITKRNEKIDRFEEIVDDEEIKRILNLTQDQSLENGLRLSKLLPFCSFETVRTKYKINNIFIDIDHAQFENLQYMLAEFEIMVSSKEDIKKAEKRVEDFMISLNMDYNKIILGKLIFFLKEKRKDHFEALVKNNVIKTDY